MKTLSEHSQLGHFRLLSPGGQPEQKRSTAYYSKSKTEIYRAPSENRNQESRVLWKDRDQELRCFRTCDPDRSLWGTGVSKSRNWNGKCSFLGKRLATRK